MNAHDVVVRTDPSNADVLLATGLRIDGQELLIPHDSSVRITIGDREPAELTVTIYARSIQFSADEVPS